ncbi:MAG: cation transporter [Desulfurococcaceae archaeon]|jgi:divalent metal cation (Fe/Co/Zn/Cd) transporter|nr:cation transporter [Desulfurococcaceae archaeon]
MKGSDLSGAVYRETYKVLRFAVLLSLFGTVVELIVAYLSSSIIIYSDVIHWVTDTSLELISMITFYIISKVSRKIKWNIFALEALLVLMVSIVLFGFYLYMLINTVKSYAETAFEPTTTNPFLAIVTAFGGFLTFVMFIVERRAYKELRTEILKVDTRHAMIDMAIAFIASIGIVLTAYMRNVILELTVVLLILYAALQSMIDLSREAVKSILGFEADPNLKTQLISKLSELNREEIKIGEVELRKMGTFYVAKVNVYLDPKITIGEAHRLRKLINILSREVSELIYHVDVMFYPMKKYNYLKRKEVHRKRRGKASFSER